MNDKRIENGTDMDWDELQDDEVMKELRELWAYQNERIEAILARPKSMPKGINPRAGMTMRHLVMIRLLVLSAVSVCAGVYALVVFGIGGCGIVRTAGYVFAFVNAAIATYGIGLWRAMVRHRPDRTGVVEMSRFMRRIQMAPMQAQRHRRPQTLREMLSEAMGGVTLSVSQLGLCCVIAMGVLVPLACSPLAEYKITEAQDLQVVEAAICCVDKIVRAM